MAEILLEKKFGHKYEFFSAGLSPISRPNMDKRSLLFLKDKNVIHNFHTPKKINHKMLSYFDKFLAVDLYVLNQLNTSFPKYRHKFSCLTMQFTDINIIDPYRFQTDEYIRVMNDIEKVVKKINLEDH